MMQSKKLFLIWKSTIKNKRKIKNLKLIFHKKSKETLLMIIRTQQDPSSTKRMTGLSSYQDLQNKKCLKNSLICQLLMFSIRLLIQVMQHPSFQTMKRLVFLRTPGSS